MHSRARIVSCLAGIGIAVVGLQPLAAQADWYTPYATPKARALHTAVYDVGNAQIVLFGGNANAGVQGDTWVWSATAGWRNAHPAQAPSARREHAMAYDAARGEVMLFGGWDGVHLNDTWLWNGSNWRLAAPANSPSVRMPELAYDPINGTVLMFGGENNAGVQFNETWSWDGATWTQLQPVTVPPVRFDHAMETDWSRSTVVLYGGWNSTNGFLGDTWIWNGSNWLQGPTGPGARSEHKMAYAGGNVVLFGGDSLAGRRNDTWQWDGTTWTLLSPVPSPSPREEHVLVGDLATGSAVLFGGWHTFVGHLADQWTFSAGQWTQDTPSQPNGTGTGAMAYDVAAGRSILFGGYQDEQVSNQTWSHVGGVWTRLSPLNPPAARAEPAMAYDRVRGECVLFGGVNGATFYNDTLAFRNGSWVPLLPANSPPARWGHAMCFDEARGTVLLFSGNGVSSILTDTWEWNGSTWTQLFPATTPSGRGDHCLAYDVARGESIMFGGWISGVGFTNETWAFRAGNWLQLSFANYPSPRSEHVMAYDRVRQCMVVFAGEAATGRDNATWELGSDWVQRAPLHAPEPREEAVMVFDEGIGELVMAVGWDLGHFTDTWHYAARPAATAVSYGAGCQGSAAVVPVLAAGRPWLGRAVAIDANSLPNNAAALLSFGFSRISLPLDPFGMAGCTMLTQPRNNLLLLASGSTAQMSLGLPANSSLAGLLVDLQAYVLAPGANAAGVITTNGVELSLRLD